MSQTLNSPLVRRKSKSSVLSGFILIVAALSLYGLTTRMPDHNSALYMFCFIVGIALLFVGLLQLFFMGKEWIYKPTGSPVKTYSLFFESLSADELNRMIRQKEYRQLAEATKKENGPVRLDVQQSRDGQFVGLQVLQYVPHYYENKGEPYYYEGIAALAVAESVGNPAK